jgi:hypothetical protein
MEISKPKTKDTTDDTHDTAIGLACLPYIADTTDRIASKTYALASTLYIKYTNTFDHTKTTCHYYLQKAYIL